MTTHVAVAGDARAARGLPRVTSVRATGLFLAGRLMGNYGFRGGIAVRKFRVCISLQGSIHEPRLHGGDWIYDLGSRNPWAPCLRVLV